MFKCKWCTKFFAAVVLAAIGALALWWTLNPKLEPIRIDQSNLTAPVHYVAGGFRCKPDNIKRLSGPKLLRTEDVCALAEEQQRKDDNVFIQSARSTDAAVASAAYALVQARVAVIGGALGFVTMAAAIMAAIYAASAAHHSMRSANIAEWGFRPWLDFEMTIESQCVAATLLSVDFKISIKNIGSNMATDVCVYFAQYQIDKNIDQIESDINSDNEDYCLFSNINIMPSISHVRHSIFHLGDDYRIGLDMNAGWIALKVKYALPTREHFYTTKIFQIIPLPTDPKLVPVPFLPIPKCVPLSPIRFGDPYYVIST